MIISSHFRAGVALVTLLAGTLAAALSNNTLSSKTPVVMMMIVLVLAYNPNRPKPMAGTAH